MIRRVVSKIQREYFKYLNNIYYKYVTIHPTVAFATEVPGKINIICPHKLSIGEGSAINANANINAAGTVFIGKYVHTGISLTIYSTNHNFRSCKGIPYDDTEIEKTVIIKDFVWIGANVSIIPGVTIREGAIVRMGSVVVKDIPDFAIVGGNSATIIGWRDKELFMKLKKEGRYY